MGELITSDTVNPVALEPGVVEALCTAIAHRRSLGMVRLLPDDVDPELIRRALVAADWAPSHGDTEPWRFVVFTGEGRRELGEAFAEAYHQYCHRSDAREGEFKPDVFAAQKERAFGSPVWISIGVEPAVRADGSLKMTIEEEIMAVSCAAQNLHLVAAAQGLAGMWLSKGVFRHRKVADFVGLSERGFLLGFFVLGYPSIPWPAGERRPLTEKVRWVS